MDHFDWLSGSQPKAFWFVIDHTLEVPMIVSIEKKKEKKKTSGSQCGPSLKINPLTDSNP